MARQHGAATPAYVPQETITNVEAINRVEHIDQLTWDFDILRRVRIGVSIRKRRERTDKAMASDIPAELVLKALANPSWDWRTLKGIADDTKLPTELVVSILATNKDQVETSESEPLNTTLYRLKNRKKPARQLLYDALNLILDVLSLGKRKLVQP